MRVVADCVVMNQSCCLELEVKESGSLRNVVTGNGLPPS